MADNINDHVTSLCLANPQQHGFSAHKFCVTKLTNIIHDWASILDRPRPPRIDAIFLDFSKAFDIMPHHTLLEKLACNFNIRGPTWTWLKSFYWSTTACHIPWLFFFMDTSYIRCPQGSVLGPLFFNLFINDISKNLNTKCLLFVDDTVIYQPIQSPCDE